MSHTAQATCACGFEIKVTQAEGGQSLYGTLSYKMARHDATCRHDSWQFLWNNTVMV